MDRVSVFHSSELDLINVFCFQKADEADLDCWQKETPKCFLDTLTDEIEASEGCEFIENYGFSYFPSNPYIKCLLNNPQLSLGRFLCLGKFYPQTEKTDQLVYSQYDSKGSAKCVTVKAACNMFVDFYASLNAVSEDQKNIDFFLVKIYKREPYSYSERDFGKICEKAIANYNEDFGYEKLDRESWKEYEIRLLKDDETITQFDYENLMEESEKNKNCATPWEIFFSIGKAVVETNVDGTTFSSIIESSMISNFNYMIEILKSMPKQDQDFIKENLLMSAKWMNRLANLLEKQPLQNSESVDELGATDGLMDYGIDYENLVKESEAFAVEEGKEDKKVT